MTNKKYSIFGAGAAGLYTAWRLLSGNIKATEVKGKNAGLLLENDVLELYDWGQYNFSQQHKGTRAPGARVCTWHYQDDKNKSYLEVGGMRYSEWDGTPRGGGHRLVTTTIAKLGLTKYSVPFNESQNPLYYLRTKNMYLDEISSGNPAPYNASGFANAASPDSGFNTVESLAVTKHKGPKTRTEWCTFYQHGRIDVDLPESSVYKKGDHLKDIGYWNLMFDQLGSEGYAYTSAGNGYTSNVINWNSAVAFDANNEFTPGTEYRTLTHGYSSMFDALFAEIVNLAQKKNVQFNYYPNTRLHSILNRKDGIHYTTATREHPNKKAASHITQAAWLAMPRYSIELVAQATRYEDHGTEDVLNHSKVQLYLESAIMQPSYKVGMFFREPWWADNAKKTPRYPARVSSYEVTQAVLTQLQQQGFPEKYLTAMKADSKMMETPYAPAAEFIKQVEQCVQERLGIKQEEMLLTAATRNTIGPSVTDTPIRQVVYFGNNALDQTGEKVYGLLAAYDDEMFTSFWQELELGPNAHRKIPLSENTQTLDGPRKPSATMVKMLRAQLAAVHFGPQADYTSVPEPLETRYMDWSLPPFNAGYHAYAAHYDVCDVQQKIRKPSQLIEGADANIFIVGEAYSNDQAWVEGAYCTAESVLNDFFGIEPLIDNKEYPFICPCGTTVAPSAVKVTSTEIPVVGGKS
ncbi:FAD-dependent oxidoreductase [Deminuibacter soli]|uniref:FAD-dependent oxidoreductase n=1 Tax=Deminuibacter soli TaxID=2291815 RepID=UPI001B86E5EB|nr:FAD-dependent oxidoreductase [Deminuibacter soli]